jgi:thiol-disulfide isomerase/thioredoxin
MSPASLLSRTLVAIFFVLTGSASLSAAFTIKGQLPPVLAGATVTVLRESLEARTSEPIATTTVADGRFSLSVDSGPGLFSLQIGDASGSFVAADGQTLFVAFDAEDLRITDAPDQKLFLAYEAFRADSLARKVTPARQATAAAHGRSDEAELARLTEQEVAGYTEHRRELNDFTLAHLRGSPALYAASLRWDGDYCLDELAVAVADYARLRPTAEIARLMTERIARYRATALGATAPGLAGKSPDGAPLALADLRGKFVLVDFWASWCGPCRVENRHYAQLYQRHRAAGFEILAVSVDQNAAAWKAAIAKDGAVWRQLSDLTGWKSPLAGAYNVSALPASFLLDREGRIVGKDLRGPTLAARLETLLAPR